MKMLQAFREGIENGLNITSMNGNTYTPDQLKVKWLGSQVAVTNDVGMSKAEREGEWTISQYNNLTLNNT